MPLKYNLENIATIIKGKFLQQKDNPSVEHLLFDSRKVIFPATSLFFALRGPRRNGHIFIPELYQKGVRNFIVDEQTDPADINTTTKMEVK